MDNKYFKKVAEIALLITVLALIHSLFEHTEIDENEEKILEKFID